MEEKKDEGIKSGKTGIIENRMELKREKRFEKFANIQSSSNQWYLVTHGVCEKVKKSIYSMKNGSKNIWFDWVRRCKRIVDNRKELPKNWKNALPSRECAWNSWKMKCEIRKK